MNFVIGILAFIVMLGLIIMIHEAGHFLAARFFGVHCHEFAFGMGPVLWQKQGKNTLFSIRALPIGGFVSMAGETDLSDDEDEDDWMKDVPQNERLNRKPVWQQMVIMAAGVVMNFLLAWILILAVVMIRGTVSQPALPVVYQVVENSPAAGAGLQQGDRITKIIAEDGSTIEPETQLELSEFLQFNPGLSTFEVIRGDERFRVQMEPVLDEETQSYLLGFTSQAPVRALKPFEAIPVSFQQFGEYISSIFRSFGMLLRGKGLNALSGPVGIYKVTDQVISYGFLPYLLLCALISLNIGIFNLIPIPALDGGRIVILAIEKLIRRKIPAGVVNGVIFASFILLFGLMIFSTYNDIIRYFL